MLVPTRWSLFLHSNANMSSQIIKFLRNEATDFNGRSLLELIEQTDHQMERTHHSIQWMFPTDIPSEHSDYAPVLTQEDIAEMKTDKVVQSSIKKCLTRMIDFYDKDDYWISQRNHNFKRITRILRCLWLAGLVHEYVCFQRALDEIYNTSNNLCIIGAETYLYWKNANNDSFLRDEDRERKVIEYLKKMDDDEKLDNMPDWFGCI